MDVQSEDTRVHVYYQQSTRRIHSKKKKPWSDLTRKGSIGAKLLSGSMIPGKSVNLTQNMTERWVNLTPLFVKSAES